MKTTTAQSRITHFFALALLCATANLAVGQTITWSGSNETYIPGASQNWDLTTNWTGGVVPSGTAAVRIQQGSALIDTTVADITSFLIGNSANTTQNRGLYIASGGSLRTTSTSSSSFNLTNNGGAHQVTVASGGTLTVGGSLVNGAASVGNGSASNFNSAGTVSAVAFTTSKNAISTISGGTLTATGLISAASGGVLQLTGGSVTGSSNGLTLSPDGTLKISGGSLGVTGNLFFSGNTTSAAARTIHVNGSGASSISFSGQTYSSAEDRATAAWKFTLDNGADHIRPITLTASGASGGTLRDGSNLNVALSGGVLLSGTGNFTLIDRAASGNSDTGWGTGPNALWTDTTAGTKELITIGLNNAQDKGDLNGSGFNSISFTLSNLGYVDLANFSNPFVLGLNVVGGTLGNFTSALTASGISWSAGSGIYAVHLNLDPAISGGNVFAWDLSTIEAGMGIQGLAVIPEPQAALLIAFALPVLVVLVLRRRRATSTI